MVPDYETFRGDKKVPLVSPLAALEKRFITRNVACFPRWIEGYHLTLTTLPWSAGLMLFGYLARGNMHWLWGSSLMLFLQWFTDSFDGALGRHRDTGIPKWGFYMDHLLDYIFMSCVFLQYLPIVRETPRYMLIAWTFLYGVKMVSSWLSFAAVGQFKITYLGVGPTEIRLFFILLNTALILFGVRFLEAGLPYALVISAASATLIIWRTQKAIWEQDRADKAARRPSSPPNATI